jgi:hypothetical protein
MAPERYLHTSHWAFAAEVANGAFVAVTPTGTILIPRHSTEGCRVGPPVPVNARMITYWSAVGRWPTCRWPTLTGSEIS